MDVEQLQQLKPMLRQYLHRFDDCFLRKDTRSHLPVYVEGQLSDLPEKTLAPIAAEARVAPRTLQEFLSLLHWDQDRMRDRLEQIVAREHAGPHSVGLIDETSFVKKGDMTPGVQRQWCGAVGKEENCLVTVHLGYARDDFHCLLDGEMYLPKVWAQDPARCREAGIPETMEYRPNWQIALELYDPAIANGIHFDWLTFDEGYGKTPAFLQALVDRNQPFVAEVPTTFYGWIDPPAVTSRPYRRGGGGGRRRPRRRVKAAAPRARTVRWLLRRHPTLRDQSWRRWRIRDGEKGPMIWEVKESRFYPKLDKLPMGKLRLLIARNVLKPEEMKFFVTYARSATSVGTRLLVGFSRWRIERCIQDGKGEVGLDHYEGRRYLGLKRHLAISAVSGLFLAWVKQTWAGEKSGGHHRPGPEGHCCPSARLVAGRTCVPGAITTRP